MDRSVEDIVKKYERDDRIRPLGLSPAPFDKPLAPPVGPYRNSSTTISGPTFGNISAISSSSGRSDSDSASRRSSDSTALSTAPSMPAFAIPPWHIHQRDMAPITYDYDLPCEFVMLECNIRYHPERYEDWIAHSISHFLGNGPPSTTVCTFCDDPAAYFHYQNPYQTWRARMLHLGTHHQEYRGAWGHRPDHFLLEHMKRYQLIDDDGFDHKMTFTERPACDNLVDYGFKTPEMKERQRKNAKAAEGQHDMRREKRQMKQEKGKGRSTYKPSKKSEVYHGPRS